MSDSTSSATRTLTITLPESEADQANQLAHEEEIALDEFFRRAVRAYKLQAIRGELDAFRKTFPPTNYTEQDVEALVHEMRREERESQVA
jgi:hypothetical protein